MSVNELESLNEGEKHRIVVSPIKEPEIPLSPSTSCKSVLRQLLVSSGVIVGSIAFGFTNGFTGTLFPHITHLTNKTTESWLAGTVVFSMILGVLFSSYSMRKYGRRRSLLMVCLPWMLGWPCMATATSVWTMLLGCSLVGFSAGLYSSISNVYVSEICSPMMRATVGILISLGVAVGILLTHALGIFLPWRCALLLSSIIPTMSFGLAFWARETPNWLMLEDRVDEAKKNFLWLRGDGEVARNELSKLIARRSSNAEYKSRGILNNIASRELLKPFAVLCFLFTAQQGSGFNMVTYYAITMLQKISQTMDSEIVTLQIDVIRVVAGVLSVHAVKTFSRRKLFFITAVGAIGSLLAIVYMTENQFSDRMLLVAVTFYVVFIHVGVLPVPWLMSAELYPSAVRDLGTAVTTLYAFFSVFLVVKLSPPLMDVLGASFVLTMYAIIVAICSIVLFFIMPETRNITLLQIEEKVLSRDRCHRQILELV